MCIISIHMHTRILYTQLDEYFKVIEQYKEGWINELHAVLPYLCAMMMVVCALLACSSSMLCCTILSEAASSADVACNTVMMMLTSIG
jgi:GTP:adenosylcobinamide-phosphate guanylyltransferase